MDYVDDVFYTKEHIWLKPNKKNEYFLGITNFAQDLLGDIVFVDLSLGNKFNNNTSIGVIESVKTASEIISPADGEIIFINPDVLSNPEKINESPHEVWLCQISIDNKFNEADYLNKNQYLSLIEN